MPNLVKARLSKEVENLTCDICGISSDKCLNVFDLKLGEIIVKVCDECINDIYDKTLRCVCFVNGRIKQPHDMNIIRSRGRKYSYLLEKAKEEQEENKKRIEEEKAWEEAIKFNPTKKLRKVKKINV